MSYSRGGRGFTKPLPGIQVDWGHSLSSGLADVILLNEGNGHPKSLLYGDVATTNTTNQPTWISDTKGVAYSWRNGPQLAAFVNRPQRNLLGAMTLHVGLRPASPSGESAFREVVNRRVTGAVGTGIEYGLYFNQSQGINFYWAAGGFSSTILVQNNLLTQNQFVTLTGTRPTLATSGKLYKDSVLLASVGALTAPTASGTGMNLGCDSNGSTDPLFGDLHYVYLWNRELSLADIEWLIAEPYCFLLPIPWRRYYALNQVVSGYEAWAVQNKDPVPHQRIVQAY